MSEAATITRHIVAKVGEIAENGSKLVHVKGRPIALFHVGGAYFAISNVCPHEGGSLCKGKLIGLIRSTEPGVYERTRPFEMLQCPWHGWEFDIRTGQSYCDPDSVRARSYAVSVKDGAELAEGPFVAETFPVSLEDHYVIVEMK
ncbi:MAG: ferredoxin subunit of nitrite reductase and ring-hydroxylating dioxygenase [Rhodospirillales bacterium]|jgi:3-phenylpropionate/trans-cinnamate dioxygenase ferredoxin subunit|nr:ferredoxin subunit of nitrite reductase and ring-hydroxylating dioxygenase [Rhodospirillales bacterium]